MGRMRLSDMAAVGLKTAAAAAAAAGETRSKNAGGLQPCCCSMAVRAAAAHAARRACTAPLTHIFHYRISVQLSRCLAVTGQSSLRAVVDATCTSLGDRFCGLQKERKT
jgi:hypothetical protein